MLRQSATDWSFLRDGMDPAAYYAALAEIGFSAVEIAEPERWPLVRAAGLELLNLAAPGIEDGLSRVEDHDRLLPLVRDTIAAAGEAGIPQVIVFSGRAGDVGDAAGRDACVRALDALAPQAEDAAVVLTFELLNSVDHAGYQACSTDFVFDVVARVDAPSVQALYDVYHAERMGEDVVADVTRHATAIAHLHVAGSPMRDFPGSQQDIDYHAVVRAAVDAGYDGHVGHEFLPGPDSLADLRAAFALFHSYAAS